MKRCVIISNYANNAYRKSLLKDKIELFNSQNIDVILASSDYMERFDGVKNYITAHHVCDAQFLTEDMYPYFSGGNKSYFRNINNRNILYSNYFIKLYQISFNYAKNLGYDFCYFIDLDVILNKDHLNFIFNEIDTGKVYFYTLGSKDAYQVTFFYGCLDVLTTFFTEDKLNYMDIYSKKHFILSNEHVAYVLAHKHKDVIELKNEEDSVFESRNLFSINNQAEVYYDFSKNEYIFLTAKGDFCKNTFGVELYEEDSLIFSNVFSQYGIFHVQSLKHNTNYTIKYYDTHISSDTLSKVTKVFTDSTKCTTPNNWIQHSD